MEYEYHLEKYHGRRSRHECPACGDAHSLTLYVDDNGNPLSPTCGRCDHESGCGYHLTPREFFADHPDKPRNFVPNITNEPKQEIKPSFIPYEYVYRSLSYDNNLTRFLNKILDFDKLECPSVMRIYDDYLIGSTKGRGTIFWQIDINGKVRTGKKIIFNPEDGHRDKNIPPYYLHSALIKQKRIPEDFHLVQCFFGEHLLRRYPDRKVAITESEKTACICSAILPDYVWLATGGISQFSIEKMLILQGRDIVLFPDADAYPKWESVAGTLEAIASKVKVSTWARDTNTPPETKMDIADLIIADLMAKRNAYVKPREPTPPPTTMEVLKEMYPDFQTLIDKLELVEIN